MASSDQQTNGMASKRPDRATKLKERKTTEETVVKCSILNALTSTAPKVAVKTAIETRVRQVSVRTRNASVALNLLVREAFHGKEDVTAVTLPEFWDVTFVRQLMLGTDDATKPCPEVKEFFQRQPCLLANEARSKSDRNVYVFAAKKFSTNICNHLVLNFPKVAKRYFYDAKGISRDDGRLAIYRFHGWPLKVKVAPEREAMIANVVHPLRAVLGLSKGQEITEEWLKKKANLPSILRMFVFVSRLLEKKNLEATEEDKTVKLFNLLPICRVKSHFITMDTESMVGLLVDVNLIDKIPPCLDDKKELWKLLLNTSKSKGKNKTFTGTIDTDGVVVNIHYHRKKDDIPRTKGKDAPISLVGKRVIGNDPGRSNIFSMAEEVTPGQYKFYRLSRGRYYTDSGIKNANAQTKTWLGDVEDEVRKMSQTSPKGSSLEQFESYVNTSLEVAPTMWAEMFKNRWRHQRFRLYGGKKRAFARFFNEVGLDKDTIIAFGAAKFAPGGKGEVSVPTTGAFKECTYRCKLVPVDEFRTSKVLWEDHKTVLQQVARMKEDGKKETVRGLLWCCSTKGTSKFVNRDSNAAINILQCAKLAKRPAMLDRSKATGKLQQHIAKVLRL